MDVLKIYRNNNASIFVNSTLDFVSNRSADDAEAYYDDYSMLEALDYWPHQVILITLYSFIAVVSFILNTVTIAVLVKCDKSISSELHIYLINLSVADIVMSLFCIPYTYISFVKNRWLFPHWACPLVNCAQITSVCVSVLTLSLIGLDRYFAIIYPLGTSNKCISIKCNKFCENRFRKLLSIVVIWIFGLCAGSVQFLFTRVVPIPFGSQTLYDCRENIPESFGKFYTIFLFLCTFAIPLVILTYVYSTIGYQVWRHVAPGNPNISRDHNNNLTRKKVIKILILIVILFFLLWAPLNVFNLLVEFDKNFLEIRSPSEYQFFVYFFLISHFLAMAHSLVNSLVYCYLSRNFWRNFCCLTRRSLHCIANFSQESRARERRVVVVRDRGEKQRTAHSIVNSISLLKKKPFGLAAAETRVIVPEPIAEVKPSNTIELNVIHL